MAAAQAVEVTETQISVSSGVFMDTVIADTCVSLRLLLSSVTDQVL